LKSLANVIKEKKHAVSQADLNIKEADHALQGLEKEKVGAVNFVMNLEKQYDWIAEQQEYVHGFPLCPVLF
jgi:structural maintenance of chromosome 2